MKKSDKQIRVLVNNTIEGFLVSLIEECKSLNNTYTIEECYNYVIKRAKESKDKFVENLSLNFSIEVVNSFKSIENDWLLSIGTLQDYKKFLKKNKIN